MTLRQPRVTPPARRHAHTSPSSCPHNAGNSCHVVVAATTAVGRAATPLTVTSYVISLHRTATRSPESTVLHIEEPSSEDLATCRSNRYGRSGAGRERRDVRLAHDSRPGHPQLYQVVGGDGIGAVTEPENGVPEGVRADQPRVA